MITSSVVFDHHGRCQKGKEGSIELRLIVNRKPYYLQTGLKCRASEFRYGKVVNREDADEMNDRLRVLQKLANEEITKLLADREEVSAKILRQRIFGVDDGMDESVRFIDWLPMEAGVLRLAPGTLAHYKVTIDRLNQYGKMKEWKDVTVPNILRWDAWLHGLKKDIRDADKKAGLQEELLSDGAVYNYHKCLKAMLNRAVLYDYIDRNPYDKLRGKFSRGDHETVEYLTEEEVEKFMALHPTPHTQMEVAHDLFVFQLYTGMGFSDVMAFDIRDYRKVDGKWVNNGLRTKTGTMYVSQLLPPVVDVLEKYGMQVPKIYNSDYNRCLKLLGFAAGITKPLHSHMARHTFATMMLKNKVRIEHVSKMLGHTNIVTTQRYAKVLAESVHEEFDKIEEMLNKK